MPDNNQTGLTDQQKKILGIVGGGLVGGSVVSDIVSANRLIKEGEGAMSDAKMSLADTQGQIKAYDPDVTQATRDLYSRGIRPTDTSFVDENLATTLRSDINTRALDPTSLFNAANRAKQDVRQQDYANEVNRLSDYATAMEQQNAVKQQLEIDQLLGKQALAQQDIAGASAQIAAAKDRKANAIPNALSSGMQIASMFMPVGEEGMKVNEDNQAVEGLLRRGEVVKTKGKFDHDTNKKALVDEETGEKEAELTGGEYVLNPEQGGEIHQAYMAVEQVLKSGETPTPEQFMALYEAVQAVFSQPQFNEDVA